MRGGKWGIVGGGGEYRLWFSGRSYKPQGNIDHSPVAFPLENVSVWAGLRIVCDSNGKATFSDALISVGSAANLEGDFMRFLSRDRLFSNVGFGDLA